MSDVNSQLALLCGFLVLLCLLLVIRVQRLEAEPRPDLRDYFAAKAMQAFLSGHIAHYGHENHWPYTAMASDAYDVADAMLERRSS